MYRPLTQKILGVAVVAAILSTTASAAHAGWWRHNHSSGGSSGSSGSSGSWGSSGSSGSSGSWGSSGSSGSWGSSGSSGSHGGLFARWRHRHHYRRAYYSHGSSGSSGSWGSHGSSGGSSGSWGSHGSGGGETYYSPQVVPDAPPQTEGELPPGDAAYLRSTEALLTVTVPGNAKVFVNGAATQSTGGQRQYISRGLDSGQSYSYEVRAELTRDGKTIEQTKTVQLQGGQASSLAFDLRDDGSVTTSLTLNVPEDAKVILGGKETSATGSVRTFRTTKLEEGKQWSDYKVVVEVEQEGRKLSKEETIALAAGDDIELSFNFADEQLASR